MEIFVIIAAFAIIIWVFKLNFFPGKIEKPTKINKHIHIVNTFAEPVPDVPAKKIKWDNSAGNLKALQGGTIESFGIGADSVNMFYEED